MMSDDGELAELIRLKGHLICEMVEDIEIVQRHLPEHVRLSRGEPGCVSFDVRQSEDPMVWHVEEAFRDRAAYEFHQKRTRASVWGQATAGIARAYDVSA